MARAWIANPCYVGSSPISFSKIMKLIELARIYRVVNDAFSKRFYNAEVVADHDELYIHLEKSQLFTDKELSYLVDQVGMYVHTTANSDNDVQSFVIYL